MILGFALLLIGVLIVVIARIARSAPAELHYIGYALIVISAVVLLYLLIASHGHLTR